MNEVRQQVPAKVSNEGLIAERRAHMIDTATALFLKKGFHETTVREIARAADWHMGKLYLYISTKEDVLFLINENLVRKLNETLRGTPRRENAELSLLAAARCLFEVTNRMGREVVMLYRESASMTREHLDEIKRYELDNRHFLQEIIEEGIAAGEFRRVNSLLVAHDVIMLASMWALKRWALVEHIDFESYFEQQMSLILGTLRPACAE